LVAAAWACNVAGSIGGLVVGSAAGLVVGSIGGLVVGSVAEETPASAVPVVVGGGGAGVTIVVAACKERPVGEPSFVVESGVPNVLAAESESLLLFPLSFL
jgi:hypothetical protein